MSIENAIMTFVLVSALGAIAVAGYLYWVGRKEKL